MWIWSLACDPGGEVLPDSTFTFRSAVFPEGPGDVLVVDLDQQEPTDVLTNVQPLVEAADGAAVALVERTYLGFSYGWAPADGFPPGTYTLVGTAGFPVALQEPFEVLPFGERALDGAGLVGRSWELLDGRSAPGDLAPIAFTQGTASVSVERVDGELLTFALVYQSLDGDCLALRDRGVWDPERGVLRWEVDQGDLELPTSDGSLTLPTQDLWMEVQWLADDPSRAVGQASGVVDTRELSEALDPGSGPLGTCAIMENVGFPCVPCPDGVEACAAIQVVKGTLRERSPLDAAALPLCGVDRVNVEVPDFSLSCDLPVDVVLDPGQCGCSALGRAAGLPLSGVALALLVRRRTRGGSRTLRTPASTTRTRRRGCGRRA